MGISRFFPEKEITKEEKQKREAKKEFKKLRRKFIKNPLKVTEIMEEAYDMMDRWVESGVMSEKERENSINQINKDMEKANKIMNKFRG